MIASFPGPRRLPADDPALPEVLSLIHAAFAGMEGRIDPPSSVHRLSPAVLSEHARQGELWVIGTPPIACIQLTPRGEAMHMTKLAVAAQTRGHGLARRLVELAEERARLHALPALELQSRIELVEVHAVFAALGFVEVARTAHPGHARPTSITFRKELA